ncbi:MULTISPECIES: hypothetical protein [unclassified Rubrivivax]|uniref:hypothetical protein n=1 Tax=unclassified Rubrivivax TaxID=2649762 RepID=UPI0013E99DF7|nr:MULTISPECIES: hypothetical protein [unclassified Rubrivivax]MCC9596686.1 hypothetical protein [Rubrivivax sp. JA1055]MCC9648843.1 hypothetical protein [Rubrivivax sp. JA1029]
MEQIAVFVDDAEHARRILAPMLAQAAGPTRWVVVGCAPKLTHRVGKWVSHRSRENWREQWLRTLRDRLEPTFAMASGEREWMVARAPLPDVSARLRRRLGADLRLLDARRPKLGAVMPPLSAEQPAAQDHRWSTGLAVATGMATVLALTD